MRRTVLVAALVLAAPGAAAAERVVVLESKDSSTLAWPSGQRAVVAELMAADVELVLRQSSAETVGALELEVLEAAREPDTAGAVGVGREGSIGFALVTRGGRGPVRIEDDVRQGPLADGAVALRVSEVLRVRRFDLPPEPPAKAHARTPELVREPEPPRSSLWPWLAVAGMATRGSSSVVPAIALGLRVPISGWLSLEPAAAFSLGRLRVSTSAGDVGLSARQATLELVLAPTDREGISGGVAAGGGVAWVSGSARANAGYRAADRSTQVSLLALRGFGAWQLQSLRLMAFAEVSALLPAVSVHASEREVARLGQPWVLSGVAVGYAP
jgi:hypothetical protein